MASSSSSSARRANGSRRSTRGCGQPAFSRLKSRDMRSRCAIQIAGRRRRLRLARKRVVIGRCGPVRQAGRRLPAAAALRRGPASGYGSAGSRTARGLCRTPRARLGGSRRQAAATSRTARRSKNTPTTRAGSQSAGQSRSKMRTRRARCTFRSSVAPGSAEQSRPMSSG